MRKLLLVLAVVVLFFTAGCLENIDNGNPPKEKYQRVVKLSEPLPAGKQLDAKMVNGAMTVNGTEAEQCNITATLETRGHSIEEAEELSGKIELTLESNEDGVMFRIKKPTGVKDNRIVVRLDVTVSSQTDLVLESVNGNIDINNVKGDLTINTVNGNLTAHGQFVKVKCSTVNGQIECDGILGDVDVSTVNGGVRALLDESNKVCNIKISTLNGGIDLDVPEGFSAKVDASTLNGSVSANIPVTVKGNIKRNKLKGTIGSGEGTVKLNTLNGSINIR